jgi:hypothetical protein
VIIKLNGVPITTQFHQVDAVHHTPHQGIDLALPLNTPVPSVGDGVITSITDEGSKSFGKAVHEHLSDGTDVVYGHLNNFNVQAGQVVHKGDIVGYSGNTGYSTGAHLHLQTMHNGVAFDPTPYVQNISVQKVAEHVHKHPWWDVAGNLEDDAREALAHLASSLGHALLDGLGVILPTLAMVGILWWMCPFLPKAEKAPKLTGTSLLVYMFYVMIKGAYIGG